MELIAVLRVLWARRWLVGSAFIVAVAIGVLMTYNVSLGVPPKLDRKQHLIGQASAQVLIDTPSSQVANLAPTIDPNALYTRASLLADLMGTAPAQQAIAARLGIPVWDLSVTPPPTSIAVPIKATPLALAGTRVGAARSRWQLAINVDPNLSIIAFSAIAPSPGQAGQLTNAAIAVLRERVKLAMTGQKVPALQQVVVNVIDPSRGGVLATGPRKLYGIAAALVVFFLSCFAIVVGSGLRRRVSDRQPPAEVAEAEDLSVQRKPRMVTGRKLSTPRTHSLSNGRTDLVVAEGKRTQRARDGAAG